MLRAAYALLAVASIELSADALATEPERYDGKRVAVTGVVTELRERTAIAHFAYDEFQLCESRCVRVYTRGRPRIVDGQRVTARGTFFTVHRVGKWAFKDELVAEVVE